MKYVQLLRELGGDRRLHATDTHLSTDVLISEAQCVKIEIGSSPQNFWIYPECPQFDTCNRLNLLS